MCFSSINVDFTASICPTNSLGLTAFGRVARGGNRTGNYQVIMTLGSGQVNVTQDLQTMSNTWYVIRYKDIINSMCPRAPMIHPSTPTRRIRVRHSSRELISKDSQGSASSRANEIGWNTAPSHIGINQNSNRYVCETSMKIMQIATQIEPESVGLFSLQLVRRMGDNTHHANRQDVDYYKKRQRRNKSNSNNFWFRTSVGP